MEIGTQLQFFRKASGTSVYRLSELAKVPEWRIAAIEKGEGCTVKTLWKLCDALDLRIKLEPVPTP